MSETLRSDPTGLPRKDTTLLSSGTFDGLPTIPQARPLGAISPVLSDEFDFAGRQRNSLRVPEEDESPATDYLNGGHPHDRVPPLPEPVAASWPHVLHADSPTNDAVPDPLANTIDRRPASSGRRSVQFTNDDEDIPPIPAAHERTSSWDAREAVGRIRGSNFMARLKELAGPSVPPPPKSPGMPPPEFTSTTSSPTILRQSARPLRSADECSDDDADAEETADEANGGGRSKEAQKKKKRRIRRPKFESFSIPNTPHMGFGEPDTPGAHGRLGFLRRATLSDVGDRGGLSEGEGRERLSREQGLRRPGPWGGHRDDGDGAESPSGHRIGHHFRRLSALGGGGGGMSDGDAMTPRRPFFGGDRASAFGVQKWRQVKNTLKLLRQKKEEQFDYFKSAELMAELTAVAPAVLMFASMIQRDEHGNKRIPVLLEQLRLRIKDSVPMEGKDSERHWLFTIELEYGSGPSQMKWIIKRTIREILNLHWKYKLTLGNEKFPAVRADLGAKPKQPSFPLSAFPYLRGVRGVDDEREEENPVTTPIEGRIIEEGPGDLTAAEATVAEGTDLEDRPNMRKKRSRMGGVLGGRRKTSAFGSLADLTQAEAAAQRRKYVERQERMLEKYLQEMIHWLMFRADSNRLCRFLELSALGVRLAAEGSYHGKECYLHIQSSKGLDFRRVLTPGKVIARHSRKWFLVRQSYIVCVESPENMNIYDVYLVDPKFKIVSKKNNGKLLGGKDDAKSAENFDMSSNPTPTKHHTLKIITSERKVKLFSPNQHLIQQFEESIVEMLKSTPWHLQNRFNSFAPVRTGVFAQWLVDGRDYMWNVSRAISMAKDVIYIHDWWLSPELYMRRPAAISQKWRLDRLLQKKAAEGVKIFVIVYRNVEAAVPIDSEYTKFSLLNLHPNIFVQRSPNQFKKNQFFFAHHEKLVIVDHDIAFIGGIDLCFGRWDTPQHPIADDKPTGFEPQDRPKDAEHCQLFPGKDYSNPRVQDFFKLHEPYEEMYDRGRVPRMPWHDIAMQVVGQPARDLTRHFVQRWNYVRRGRRPTRPTPFLLPPPDCSKEELDAAGLSGTCEVQMLRSASTWSLGIEDTEHSIQSAYIKMIEESDHFVYMENQFFVTSTETLNTKMVNRIGDALVERIIRAHENDEDWRAVILIPLMPGFQNEVNEQDGTSVRLILQCQFRSICRGEHSIFGRLRAAGIDPEDYIQFFSLRQWGKLGNNLITTEQLYIHAKCIIVDDRVALIGSANINERSMLGNRDSETAAIVRDTDMIWSTMAGRPYRVGRFAHTLRLRLMREHLGLDVDEILEEEKQADLDRAEFTADMERIYSDLDSEDEPPIAGSSSRRPRSASVHNMPVTPTRLSAVPSFNHDIQFAEPEESQRPKSKDKDRPRSKSKRPSSKGSKGKSVVDDYSEDDDEVVAKAAAKRGIGSERHKREVEGFGPDHWKLAQQEGIDQGRDSVVVNGREVLLHDISSEGRGTVDKPHKPHDLRLFAEVEPGPEGGVNHEIIPPMPAFDRRTTEQLGLPRASQLPSLPNLDDTDIGGPPVLGLHQQQQQAAASALTMDINLANIDKDCMRDPLNSSFYDEVWCRVAENNTKLYRRVFRCMPDSEVTNWAEYKEFKAYNQKFMASMMESSGTGPTTDGEEKHTDLEKQATAGGAGIGAPGPFAAAAAAMGMSGAAQGLSEKVSPGPMGQHSHKVAGESAVLDEKASLADDFEGMHPEPEKPIAQDSGNGYLRPNSPPGVERRPSNATNTPRSESRKDRERRTTFSSTLSAQDKLVPPGTATSAVSGHSGLSGLSGNTGLAPNGSNDPAASPASNLKTAGSQRNNTQRRRRATTRGSRRGFSPTDEVLGRDEAEEVMKLTQGTLVQFPYHWLVTEESNGNWLFQVDQVAPLQIYN